MGAFDVDADWYARHWYSPKPPTKLWRVPTALATIAVVMIAGLCTSPRLPVSSARLTPPFLQPQTITHLALPSAINAARIPDTASGGGFARTVGN
jgi:hypothetical protein